MRYSQLSQESLQKAHDSALLAVEVYNKPAVSFRSGAFIVLMVIAWTALFHAISYKHRKKPWTKRNRKFVILPDGECKGWELSECLSKYFGSDTENPVRKNVEFFIPLRNKFEHRSYPELDANIFAECQAMLLNFDEMIQNEFGDSYCLRESLSFSLQLFPSSRNLVEAVKSNPDAAPIVDFIQKYRSSISSTVLQSGKYSFKAFLIQVANHQREDTLPVQFIHYDGLSDVEKAELGRFGAMVKYKEVPVHNADLIKPTEVVRLVQQGLANPKIMRGGKKVDKFSADTHIRCWKHYKVRPLSQAIDMKKTNTKYCIYDGLNGNYGYTQQWVSFLIEKMSDEKEYASLYTKPSAT